MSNADENENTVVQQRIKKFEKNLSEIHDETNPNDDTNKKKTEFFFRSDSVGRLECDKLDYDRLIKNARASGLLSKFDLDDQHECWICLQHEGSSPLIKPCGCKGSTQYVHNDCFTTYLYSKKDLDNVNCTFCRKKYIIRTPNVWFTSFYEIMGKANRFISNGVFIGTVFTMAYIGIMAYGVAVLWFFFGKTNLLNYLCVFYKNSYVIQKYKFYNVVRVLLGAPMIPVVILASTHLNFKIPVHVIAPVLLIDGFNIDNLILSIGPITLLFYFKVMHFLQMKMGKVEFTDDTGIMFNDHYLIMTKIVNGLMMPFFGMLLGRKAFKKIYVICSYFFKFDPKKYDGNSYIRIWSFVGCISYILGCDLLCFVYLIMRKKKMKGIIVFERKNIFFNVER